MFRAGPGAGSVKNTDSEGTKSALSAKISACGRHGINLSNRPPNPYMAFNPAKKAPLHGPAVPSWAEDDSQ
jgi:hypothetical protein